MTGWCLLSLANLGVKCLVPKANNRPSRATTTLYAFLHLPHLPALRYHGPRGEHALVWSPRGWCVLSEHHRRGSGGSSVAPGQRGARGALEGPPQTDRTRGGEVGTWAAGSSPGDARALLSQSSGLAITCRRVRVQVWGRLTPLGPATSCRSPRSSGTLSDLEPCCSPTGMSQPRAGTL